MSNSLVRTEAMTQKMRCFTDAGRYPQDEDIDFLPEGHVYLYKGQYQLLPVSTLIAFFFEPFDAQRAAQQQQDRYGIPIAESLAKWERIGRMASSVGTFVHEQAENYFQNGSFHTTCYFSYGGQTEAVSVEREHQQFLHFVNDYHIRPYRQEWPVYDTALNIAGTIDLICKDEDGQFTIYDWKRSRKVCTPQGQPIVTPFGGKTALHGLNVPDTSFYHYCIQQNLYRMMLQRNYGIRVKAMNLVVLCPDYSTYHVVPVPVMDQHIHHITTLCLQQDLGHRLLG
jgi:hypothetical protein